MGETLRTLAALLDEPPVSASARAVEDADESVTWGELRQRVDALVAAVRVYGVRPGDRVGVMLDSSARAFVAVHAVLRAGAVVVPLDPRAPADFVAGLLRDCGVSLLVTESSVRRLEKIAAASDLRAVIGPELRPATLAGVAWADVDTSSPSAGPSAAVEAADPAYLIYTSGSTGRPKGILHTHASGLAYARLASETYGLDPADVVTTLSPLHFDQSTFSLYAAPLVGAAVLMVPGEVTRFPADLTRLVAARGVTVWYSVPTLLLQVLHRGVLEERDLTALRWVLFGGENILPTDLAALMAHLPRARFSNVYGPAEVNQCTYHHLDGPPAPDQAVPIGRPWAETEVCVVDDDGRPVADHAAGELLVRTSTAMAGYWGDPAGTGSGFVRGPDDGPDEPRWYATGDLARWDDDGRLVFVGRRDNQVKVRGYRIELEAVDLALQGLEGVRAAVAVVRSAGSGLDEVVGLVEGSGVAEGRAARRRLAETLSPQAVPSEVIVVDQLPRTSTGKVDRGAATRLLDDVSPSVLHSVATDEGVVPRIEP